MKQSGRLRGEGLVTTVMSNLGLERFLQSHDLRMERTRVGDRFVLERIRDRAGISAGSSPGT